MEEDGWCQVHPDTVDGLLIIHRLKAVAHPETKN